METSSIQTSDISKNMLPGRGLQWSAHLQTTAENSAATVSRNHRASGAHSVRPRSVTSSAVRPFSLSLDVSSRFGLKLRELRRERSLTQLRMANEFGIDRSFISDVERGRKSISLPMLEVIALGMKISLSELLRDI